MRVRAQDRMVAALGAGVLLLAAGPASADIQMQTVSWRVPADSPRIDGFRVYVDDSPAGDALGFEGTVTPDSEGVYSVPVAVSVGERVYVRVTAYNASGESPPSATDTYELTPPPTFEPLGQPGQPQVVP